MKPMRNYVQNNNENHKIDKIHEKFVKTVKYELETT